MKHSEGEWWADSSDYGGSRWYIKTTLPKGDCWLATVDSEDEYNGRLPVEANARLMAAAPELLAALKEAITWADSIDLSESGDEDPRQKWRNAILKAEHISPRVGGQNNQ